MAIKIRPYKRGGFEVDITVHMPDGTTVRERKKSPVGSKSGSERWARAREREILMVGISAKPTKEVPKLKDFWPRFIRDHARANGQKPSGIESKEYGYRQFLAPMFADAQLDQISNAQIAALKSRMAGEGKANATINNTLALMSKLLKVALDWGVIDAMPCRITRLKRQAPTPKFYDFDEYERLVEVARRSDARAHLLVLLGGDAGLRRGEIIALDQANCDTRRGLLIIERSEWNGHLTATKGMEARIVPMTPRLNAAIAAHKHIIGPRLLYGARGRPGTAKVLREWMRKAQRAAGLRASGELHILRHSFCSHLAMRGAPALSIQKLAGHQHLQTTLRYMHLVDGETDRAIRLLGRGDILETRQNMAKDA